jgi:lipopolysaccharide/colanic/teichoic acid biosynthesis glycosyltransferase
MRIMLQLLYAQNLAHETGQDQLGGIAYCQSHTKRLLDIGGALVGLVLLLPIFLVAMVIVRVVDGVPPIFRQARYGYGGQPFTILKLRTFPIDEQPSAVNPQRIQHKPNYTTTRTGKFWRVHSIDEIIQFWLVLKGEMSLVGHRAFPIYYVPHLAEMPQMTAELAEQYLQTIAQYKPGMTALSAIHGRGNLSLQEKIVYDRQYAEQASLWLDIHILVRSIMVVLTCEGAK